MEAWSDTREGDITMSSISGDLVSSSLKDEKEVHEYLVKARSESSARRKGKANMRVKGASSPEVENVEVEEERDSSSRDVYRVTVSARR